MSDELRSMFALSLTREILDQIKEERVRQIEKEGFSIAHDDEHVQGEIARAAATYAIAASRPSCAALQVAAHRFWPWDWKWFKPKNPRHDLVRAAALIVAEIERLDRIERAAKYPIGLLPEFRGQAKRC